MQNHSPSELDQLGDEIALLSAHLDAATARLLDLIREFDARGGWNSGFRSCAAWLSWRVGLDLGAARERVRVARALGTLPRLAQALARGELSYAKVRALTRVATPETEERLLAVGRAGTTEHVERIVRGWRRGGRNAQAPEGPPPHARPALHVYLDTDGTLRIPGRLPAGTRAPVPHAAPRAGGAPPHPAPGWRLPGWGGAVRPGPPPPPRGRGGPHPALEPPPAWPPAPPRREGGGIPGPSRARQ